MRPSTQDTKGSTGGGAYGRGCVFARPLGDRVGQQRLVIHQNAHLSIIADRDVSSALAVTETAGKHRTALDIGAPEPSMECSTMSAQQSRRTVLRMIGASSAALAAPLHATAAPAGSASGGTRPFDVDRRIQEIINRSEFAGSRWGMRFAQVGALEPIYALNPTQLFVPASAVKVFIGGTVFEQLGAGKRLRTTVYRTGPVTHGELHGDLVLAAGGDMLIGGRLGQDGSVALPEPDHSYDRFPGAGQAPGDPLATLRDIAQQVRARGIRRVGGRVLVDTSLFRDGLEDIASGAPIMVSPIMVNDNLVDITVTPDASSGAPATLVVSPNIGYLTIRNQVRTVADAATARPLVFADEVTNPDGTRTVSLTGDVPLGRTRFCVYYVPTPAVFAATAFAAALRDTGVAATAGMAAPAGRRLLVAEHVPLPVSEQVKVMLKISSNIHTVMWPYVVGAVAGLDPDTAKATYQTYQRALYQESGLDPDAPGLAEGRYSPDFFVTFLSHLNRKRYFRPFHLALPILGVDGSLSDITPDSPAVGHVFAKTGTGVGRFDPSAPPAVYKALAGYIELPNGRWVAFAEFMEATTESIATGQALADKAAAAMGEIAAVVYETSS